jgi:acyl carrier protein
MKTARQLESGERIIQLILEALASVNELLPANKRIPATVDGVLYGRRGRLDSLGLVRLLATIEQLIEEEYSISINFGEDIDRLQKIRPFKTIKTLADYVSLLMKENSTGKSTSPHSSRTRKPKTNQSDKPRSRKPHDRL